jgi:hypothetical protein
LVIGALSHVVVLDKKDRDEYVQKRDMVATKMTPAQIVEAQVGSSCLRKHPKLPLSHLLLSRASADYPRSLEQAKVVILPSPWMRLSI